MFKTISENTTAEIVEKKSRFIANIFYVEFVNAFTKSFNVYFIKWVINIGLR